MAAEWSSNKQDRNVLSMTVREAMKGYTDAKEKVLSPSTVNSYRQILRTGIDDIGPYAIGDLTPKIIQKWINEL